MKRLTKKKEKNLKRGIRIVDIIVVSLIVITGFYFVLNYNNLTTYASSTVEDYGLWALFIFTFIFELLPQIVQLISPDYILLLAIGLGMNIYYVVIVSIVASAIGSWLGFVIGWHYGFRVVAPFFNKKKLDKILRFWGRHGKWFVLIGGTVPLPFPYLPVVFGALRMSKKDFIFWGIIPRAIGFIATGVVGYFWLNWLMGFF